MLSHFIVMWQVQDPNDVPPVIATPHHYLISIYRDSIHTVAVTQSEGKITLLLVIWATAFWKQGANVRIYYKISI